GPGQLRTVARDYRQLALHHPRVVPLLVTRPLGHPARAPAAGDSAPARRCPHPAYPRRLQRARRPAHLPGPLRLPARPRPQRAPEAHRQPRRDRRPAAARPRPAPPPARAPPDAAADLGRALDTLPAGLTATLPARAPARRSGRARHPAR